MRCRSGDQAVVIDSLHPANLGRIVTVLRPCKPTLGDELTWVVRGSSSMNWTCQGQQYQGTEGPALDAQLQPLNGGKPERWRPGCQEQLIGMDDFLFGSYMDDTLLHSLLRSGCVVNSEDKEGLL
jgi:hypothetical protein